MVLGLTSSLNAYILCTRLLDPILSEVLCYEQDAAKNWIWKTDVFAAFSQFESSGKY